MCACALALVVANSVHRFSASHTLRCVVAEGVCTTADRGQKAASSFVHELIVALPELNTTAALCSNACFGVAYETTQCASFKAVWLRNGALDKRKNAWLINADLGTGDAVDDACGSQIGPGYGLLAVPLAICICAMARVVWEELIATLLR